MLIPRVQNYDSKFINIFASLLKSASKFFFFFFNCNAMSYSCLDVILWLMAWGNFWGLFSLKCADFGPYTLDFTSSGRYMAAAGRKGHLAVVDMKNMSLIKEMQVCPGVARLIWPLLRRNWVLVETFYINWQNGYLYASITLHLLLAFIFTRPLLEIRLMY